MDGIESKKRGKQKKLLHIERKNNSIFAQLGIYRIFRWVKVWLKYNLKFM
ncbi:hypothetical protein FIC_01968 [Flavobacteriaceae bacterium 3519-10]|nr:hypothetical protein FIC_01968 [Flavobacteriaceae bacterium 3519-10]